MPMALGGYRWQKLAKFILAEHSNTCYICRHQISKGAHIDHIIPLCERPELAFTPSNLAPAHGSHPCDTCGHRCNLVKNGRSLEYARRAVLRPPNSARRPWGGTQKREPVPAPRKPGRDWLTLEPE